MPQALPRRTAQKIVDAVKEVCGYDINYINKKGIIFASTDSSRIGDFHEIGRKVVETGEPIEVSEDSSFSGTHKGVNIPIVYKRDVIAAIGISGDPGEVRKYAMLSQRITALIIKEHELDSANFNKRSVLNYVIRALTEGGELSVDYLSELFEELELDPSENYRTVLITLDPRYNISNTSLIEREIYRMFDQMNARLYTFNFPNEYVLILPDREYEKSVPELRAFTEKYSDILSGGAGSSCNIWMQTKSCEEAQIAAASLEGDGSFCEYDELDLELILGRVDDNARAAYAAKVIPNLEDEDIEVLRTYFIHDMSLKDAAEELFIHKNTLQYKLNRIEKLTGQNPRKFKDAVKLYLALKLQK